MFLCVREITIQAGPDDLPSVRTGWEGLDRLKREGRPPGLTGKTALLSIHRVAHFRAQYCAEWLMCGVKPLRDRESLYD